MKGVLANLLVALLGVALPASLVVIASGNENAVSLFALACGASAFSLMALNLFLATRPKPLEGWLGGLDRLYFTHKWTGMAVLVLAWTHEILDIDLDGQIVATGLAKSAIDIAELVFPVLIGLIAISFFKNIPKIRRDVIPYHWWRWSHRLIGFVFAVLVVHQFFVKVPFDGNALAAQYLNGMALLGLASFVYTQFLAPFRPRSYQIVSVEKHPAATIVEARPRRRPIRFRPGRFAVISIGRRGLREPHPFTISGVKDDGTIQFSIRGLGDYTHRLRERVQVGDKLYVEGSYGRFDYTRGPQNQVWLAGGIGITPFLAFADSIDESNRRNILLIYCVTREEEVVGLDRLRAAEARSPGFKVCLWLSDEAGRFDAQKLIELVPFELTQAGLWFCGPGPMREAILAGLRKAGKTPAEVHFEKFEFR